MSEDMTVHQARHWLEYVLKKDPNEMRGLFVCKHLFSTADQQQLIVPDWLKSLHDDKTPPNWEAVSVWKSLSDFQKRWQHAAEHWDDPGVQKEWEDFAKTYADDPYAWWAFRLSSSHMLNYFSQTLPGSGNGVTPTMIGIVEAANLWRLTIKVSDLFWWEWIFNALTTHFQTQNSPLVLPLLWSWEDGGANNAMVNPWGLFKEWLERWKLNPDHVVTANTYPLLRHAQPPDPSWNRTLGLKNSIEEMWNQAIRSHLQRGLCELSAKDSFYFLRVICGWLGGGMESQMRKAWHQIHAIYRGERWADRFDRWVLFEYWRFQIQYKSPEMYLFDNTASYALSMDTHALAFNDEMAADWISQSISQSHSDLTALRSLWRIFFNLHPQRIPVNRAWETASWSSFGRAAPIDSLFWKTPTFLNVPPWFWAWQEDAALKKSVASMGIVRKAPDPTAEPVLKKRVV